MGFAKSIENENVEIWKAYVKNSLCQSDLCKENCKSVKY